jgi:tripartite motif-containing protein 71
MKVNRRLNILSRPNKLLYALGKYGAGVGDFKYPRGVCTTMSGNILVADSKNNRIQEFTKFGVIVQQFGSFGEQNGEFNEPCDVVELINGAIIVADSRNRRLQVN